MRSRYIINLIMTFLFVFPCTQAYSILVGQEECDYWDNGNARVSRAYTRAGDLAEVRYYRKDGSLEQLEKYDEYGHKIEESCYAGNGNLRATADGWASIRWKYENGKMVAENYYDDNGQLIECKRYNELGDLIAKQYVGDNDLDTSEEFNPQPPLENETISYYDSNGRPEGETSVIRE